MTDFEKKVLATGCVGVVAIELSFNRQSDGMPPVDRTYASFELAQKKAEELEKNLKGSQQRVLIYSIRFWSNDPNKFKPDENGKIDMSDWSKGGYKSRGRGYYNFNYGLYDKKNKKWWDANHAQPGMKVKPNTLSHFSRPLKDYNKQVFCIATTIINLK
jgi:hypothetical protein